MLGTSDAWSTSRLTKQTSKPAYYIVDCQIFGFKQAHAFKTSVGSHDLFQAEKRVWLYLVYHLLMVTSLISIPYSRKQKHVSISDTPVLLIEINSSSNMGFQK